MNFEDIKFVNASPKKVHSINSCSFPFSLLLLLYCIVHTTFFRLFVAFSLNVLYLSILFVVVSCVAFLNKVFKKFMK